MDIFNIFIQKDNKNRLMKNKMQFIIHKNESIQEMSSGHASQHSDIYRKEMTLSDLLHEYQEKKRRAHRSESTIRNIKNTLEHLQFYDGGNISLVDVDRDYLTGFISYLSHDATEKRHGGHKRIKRSTSKLYAGILSSCLLMACREHYLQFNPWKEIDSDMRREFSHLGQNSRHYLTTDEIAMLMKTPMKNSAIKNAFLFACFTGLRISDISRLQWSNIIEQKGALYLTFEMQKTRLPLTIKLNQSAISFLPPQKKNEKVFDLPRHLGSVNYRIKTWARKAGINKNISFHTSRHTFATLELTLGADLYVVSKLLGHTNIQTTQIYADIIDKKRDEAIDLIDTVF